MTVVEVSRAFVRPVVERIEAEVGTSAGLPSELSLSGIEHLAPGVRTLEQEPVAVLLSHAEL